MITKITAFILSLISLFNTFFVSISNMFETEEPATTQSELSIAKENFENSLYDENGEYVFDSIRLDLVNTNDPIYTSTVFESGDTPYSTEIDIEISSSMVLTALKSLVLPYAKKYISNMFASDSDKYKDFFSTSDGVLYLINRLDQIDSQFRELTNLVEKNSVEQQLIDRNTLIDNLSSKTDTTFNTFIKYSANIDNPGVKAGLVTIVNKWAHANTTGVENVYAVTNLLKNITVRTTGETYPELYDKYATYIYDWEMESYEYREMARTIDNVTLMKAYILLEFYYTNVINTCEGKLTENRGDIESEIELAEAFECLNQLTTYLNDYISIMEEHPVEIKDTTRCYITGLESLNVSKNLVHFEYVRNLYNKRDYFNYNSNETIQETLNYLYTNPIAYLDADFTTPYSYSGNFKYSTKDVYQKLYDYYKEQGTTLLAGLKAAGFEGIDEENTCFVFESDRDELEFGSDSISTGTALYRNVKLAWRSFKSYHDYCDIYCLDRDGKYKWHSCAISFNVNINKNGGKKLYGWDTDDNLNDNRTDWDFCSFILA